MQPYPSAPALNPMDKHLRAVAVINIILGAIAAAAALFVMAMFGIASAATGAASEVDWLPGFLVGLGIVLVVALAVVALLHIMAGVMLNRRKRSGKTLAIVAAALSLLNFPLGTAFAIYSGWVLLQRETDALLVP